MRWRGLSRRMAQTMGHRLQEMKDTRLKVDTTDLREFIKDFKRLKESKDQVPQWIVILLVVSIFGAFFGWGFAFKALYAHMEQMSHRNHFLT